MNYPELMPGQLIIFAGPSIGLTLLRNHFEAKELNIFNQIPTVSVSGIPNYGDKNKNCKIPIALKELAKEENCIIFLLLEINEVVLPVAGPFALLNEQYPAIESTADAIYFLVNDSMTEVKNRSREVLTSKPLQC